jgi:HKD family nuclease
VTDRMEVRKNSRMDVQFLLQPFTEGGRIGDALSERADSATALWIMAAWAQESGLKHLLPIIDKLHMRGGRAEAIIGLDHGLATYEGLRLAREIFDVVHLFHDSDSTFHPKLYVIEDDTRSRVIIGSGNVTVGGLYENYEATAAVHLNRTNRQDEATRRNVRMYFDSFIADGMPVRLLDRQLLKKLHAEGVVASAAARRRVEHERRQREQQTLRSIFGNPVPGLPDAPRVRSARMSRGAVGRGGAAGKSSGKPLYLELLDRFDFESRANGTVHRIKSADRKLIVEVCSYETGYTRLNLKWPPVTKTTVELWGDDPRFYGGVEVTKDNLADCQALVVDQVANRKSSTGASQPVTRSDIRAGRIRFPRSRPP